MEEKSTTKNLFALASEEVEKEEAKSQEKIENETIDHLLDASKEIKEPTESITEIDVPNKITPSPANIESEESVPEQQKNPFISNEIHPVEPLSANIEAKENIPEQQKNPFISQETKTEEPPVVSSIPEVNTQIGRAHV